MMVGRALAVLLLLPLSQAAPPPFAKKTYVFKKAGETSIELDVHRAESEEILPTLVWIHGGALLMGNRQGVPRNLLDLCRKEGFALVSIDYRLAPQAKLPDIVEDLKDAFGWIRGPGAGLAHLDANKLVVAGGSAGGYLTLLSGTAVTPRPLALVSYWGYGDVDGDWYTKPSEHYLKTLPRLTREEATGGLLDRVVTAPPDPPQAEARSRYYHYLRQNGLWTREVTGFEPGTDRAKLDPYCPVRKVTPAFPPTLLVHGTEDTDVPYELSAAMDRELTRQKVEHELVTVPGAGHGLSGGDRELVAQAHAKALDYIRKKLK
jgi:acetyl esterase/lipase